MICGYMAGMECSSGLCTLCYPLSWKHALAVSNLMIGQYIASFSTTLIAVKNGNIK